MGGKTETTTRSRTNPSRWLMPHINTVLGGARSLYGAGPAASGSPFSGMQSRFGGMGGFGGMFGGRRSGWSGMEDGVPQGGQPTYAEFSPTTERALQGYEDRAAAGSPILDAGAEQLMGTLRGDYLTPDSNPFLRQYGDALAGHVQDRVNAEFSKAGRYGSGRHAGTTAREVGGILSGLYGGAYENERSRMAGAIPQSIPFANQDYRDLQAMLGAGQLRDVKAQQVIDDPHQRIMRYLSIIRGVPQGTESYGKQTETSTPGALDIIGGLGSIAAIPMTGGTSLLGGLLGGVGGGAAAGAGTMWG